MNHQPIYLELSCCVNERDKVTFYKDDDGQFITLVTSSTENIVLTKTAISKLIQFFRSM